MQKRSITLWLVMVVVSSLAAQEGIAFLGFSGSLLETAFKIERQDVVMPFDLDRGMIYVEAEVEENSGQYVLDTGAPSLVINEVPEGLNKSSYIAQSCSAEVAIGVKQVDHFSWAGGDIKQVEAIMLDLSHLERARDGGVAGMIGYDILKKYTLLLDFEKQVLALIRPRAWKKWSERSPLVCLPFVLDEHLPIIEVELNGQMIRLGVDTGAASNLMSTQLLNDLGEDSRLLKMASVQGLDQEIKPASVRKINQLRSADFYFSDEFMSLDLSHLNTGEHQLDGLLGYPFLSRYIVAIDYRRQLLLLWSTDN